jgi:hypothetical protein
MSEEEEPVPKPKKVKKRVKIAEPISDETAEQRALRLLDSAF